MYDLRNLPGSKHLRAACIVLLGALCAIQVNARTFVGTTVGNRTTFAATMYGAGSAAEGAAFTIANGAIQAAQQTSLRTASGATAALALRAPPVAGAISSAVLACFGIPVCLAATVVTAGVVAGNLYYNYSVDPSTGLPVITKTDPDVCADGATCTLYRHGAGGVFGPYKRSYSSSCSAGAAAVAAAFPNDISGFYGTSYQGNSGCFVSKPNGSVDVIGGEYIVVQGSGNSYVPSNPAELAQAIGAKTDWPVDSKVTELLEQIVKNTTQKIPLQVPSVTGPAEVVLPPKVTTKADGSKTTTTTKLGFGYAGPTATVTEETKVEETTPAGVTTTTSTTAAPANTEEEVKDEYDVPDGDIPKSKKTITFNAENLGFAGGSCPANVMQNINGAPVVLFNWTSHCSTIVNYAKPMILALATFAALMIIFGAKTE